VRVGARRQRWVEKKKKNPRPLVSCCMFANTNVRAGGRASWFCGRSALLLIAVAFAVVLQKKARLFVGRLANSILPLIVRST